MTVHIILQGPGLTKETTGIAKKEVGGLGVPRAALAKGRHSDDK